MADIIFFLFFFFFTDCGAAAFTNDMIRDGLQKQFPDNRELSQMEFGALSTR